MGGKPLQSVDDAGEDFCCMDDERCMQIHEDAYRKGYINNDFGLLKGAPVDPVPNSSPSDAPTAKFITKGTFLEKGVKNFDGMAVRAAQQIDENVD